MNPKVSPAVVSGGADEKASDGISAAATLPPLACPSCAMSLAEPNDDCSARNWHEDDEREDHEREAPSSVLKWWSVNWNGGRREPCIHCGKPALLLDDAGRPSHKTCCQATLAQIAGAS